MTTATSSHLNREQPILNDLERRFPDFAGNALSWVHNPDDPPDFIAQSPAGTIGLEFREWLGGQQMSAAQHRDDQREHLLKVIGDGWKQECQPKNIVLASIKPRWGFRIASSDEAVLRQEFYKCATAVEPRQRLRSDADGQVVCHRPAHSVSRRSPAPGSGHAPVKRQPTQL